MAPGPRPAYRRVLALSGALALAAVGLASIWLIGGPGSEAAPSPPSSVPATPTAGEAGHVAAAPPSEDTRRVPATPAAPAGATSLAAPPSPGPRLRVRVLGGEQPLAGARVDVRIDPAPAGAAAVLPGVTDEHGAWEARVGSLEASHAFELAARAVQVRVRCAGWRPQERRLRADQLYQRGFELEVALQPGAALLGRVVDADGRGLAQASVTLLAAVDPSGDDLTMLARTSTGPDGTFAVGFEPRTQRAELLAAHAGHGCARAEVALAGSASVDVGDLRLEPAGELAGRVLFPDGTPARRAQVLATLVESGGRPHRSAHEPTMPGGRVVSDERGRFRFALLNPGVYSLHVGNPYTVSRLLAFPSPSAPTYATPARDVQLEATHVALCVRVVDRQGRALQGAGVELRRLRPDTEVDEEGAPGELRLADRSFARTAGADPLALLALDPGDRAVLSATLPSCHPVQTLITAGDRPGEQHLTLQVFSLADAARVLPRVVDRTGAGVQDYRVDVFDPYSRLLVRTELGPDAEGALPAIAPGTWLLQARSPQSGAHTSGPLPAGLGALVALRPDGPQRVELLLE